MKILYYWLIIKNIFRKNTKNHIFEKISNKRTKPDMSQVLK